MVADSVFTANRLANSDDSQLADEAVQLAALLSSQASRMSNRAERRRQKKFARLLENEDGKTFVGALTDEVLRVRSSRRAADRFTDLVTKTDLRFATIADRIMLRTASRVATKFPRLIMPMVEARIRREASNVVVSADDRDLARHVRRREAQGVRLNMNILGEAVLGEEEADRRLDLVLRLLKRPDVNYVSVKLSAISSRLKVVAFDETVAEVADRLQRVYRQAAQHDPPKFVNLDMEEYRDLQLTIEVLKTALVDPDLARLDVGIVLQAYLPDSIEAADQIANWAVERFRQYGARTKIRLVKGANLAMEKVDGELHGWKQAPFASKAETDANFKRLLDQLLDPVFDPAIQIGLGSHNLFDVAWGLVVAAQRGGLHRLEIEMLEGMAPAQALAVRDHAGDLILYTPMVARNDFVAAIAYLARRLDENTAPDNYLRHVASLQVGGHEWDIERDRFLQAARDRHLPPALPGRSQDRSNEDRLVRPSEQFENEPDTDFSSAANRRWMAASLSSLATMTDHKVLFDAAEIDRTVNSARVAGSNWAAKPHEERCAVLHRVADVMATQRGATIATMVHEAGKTVLEGDPEVSEALDFARYYAESSKILNAFSDVSFQPHKVVLVAPPWNFPYAIPAGGVFAALAAGSAVILKPAPESVQTAFLLAEQCWAGGVPRDLLQFVPCADDDIGKYLVTHPGIDAVILTGGYETAQLFLKWRPELELHAETSGKNAIVITAAADIDAAVRDLVRSAFGHSGQKCSAASLAIVERSVLDDPAFLRQLRDATTSLVVGPALDPRTDVAPLVRRPDGATLRALTTLDQGESWLVTPRVSPDNPHLWSPGIRLGVQRGSWFQQTECFGPVLGIVCVGDLAEAIEVQNDIKFGLTAGIHSLDTHEVKLWTERVQAGNLYINRTITGAIVGRQPFGGWKRSSVGPTVKAGGPNYVMTLGTWHQPTNALDSKATLAATAATTQSFARWWRDEFAGDHDPSQLRSESNTFRYRQLDGIVVFRVTDGVTPLDIATAVIASATSGVSLCISTPKPLEFDSNVSIQNVKVVVESDEDLANRLSGGAISRLRAPGNSSVALAAASHLAGIVIDTAPVVRNGRVELIHWVREQSVTECLHRYGLVRPRPGK